MRRMKTATLLSFLAVATVSGDDTLSRTAGFINGRTWMDMPYQQRLVFVLGLYDGIKLPLTRAEGSPANSKTKDNDIARAVYVKTFFGNSSFGEIIAGADDVYRDPANLQIQVAMALEYFQDKVNGASPESLAKELAGYRKFSADRQ
jgi:hypothetical protein